MFIFFLYVPELYAFSSVKDEMVGMKLQFRTGLSFIRITICFHCFGVAPAFSSTIKWKMGPVL
jgi:hypothetical protein